MSDLAPILQGFFRVKLMQHKDASPHTISSYRDTWRLLLHYAQQVTGTPPEKMRLAQLDHELITGCCPALKMPTREAFAMPMW